MKKLAIFLLLFTLSCSKYQSDTDLASIQIIDRNGTAETTSSKEKLSNYGQVDFLSPQPYQKVTRLFEKDKAGHLRSIITSYHPNGQPWQYLETVDLRANGTYKEWYENGILKIQATVIGGIGDIDIASQKSWLFDSMTYVWNENNNLIVEIPYSKGIIEGTATYYYKDGNIQKTVQYLQNKIHGEINEFYPSGVLKIKTYLEDDLPHGACLSYWENEQPLYLENYERGRLVTGVYYSSKGTVIAKIQKGNGYKLNIHEDKHYQLAQYKNGYPEGEVREYTPKNQLKQIYYLRNGKKNGSEIAFYLTNKKEKKKKYSIDWKDDMIHGTVKTWYENGRLESQKQMCKNKRNGMLCSWYKDGSVMLVEDYENNRLQRGRYYKKGVSNPISHVRNGSGIAYFYDLDGIFLYKVQYKNGNPLDEK